MLFIQQAIFSYRFSDSFSHNLTFRIDRWFLRISKNEFLSVSRLADTRSASNVTNLRQYETILSILDTEE